MNHPVTVFLEVDGLPNGTGRAGFFLTETFFSLSEILSKILNTESLLTVIFTELNIAVLNFTYLRETDQISPLTPPPPGLYPLLFQTWPSAQTG